MELVYVELTSLVNWRVGYFIFGVLLCKLLRLKWPKDGRFGGGLIFEDLGIDFSGRIGDGFC